MSKTDLASLRAAAARKKHLETLLADLNSQQKGLEIQLARLRADMLSEKRDVQRLEGRSLAAFFYEIIGRREEKLSEERQQAYAAAVKYDAAEHQFNSVCSDIDKYEKELADLSGCEAEYAEALSRKAQQLRDAGRKPHELIQLEQQLARLEDRRSEIKQAISAGEHASALAHEAEEKLSSAEDWGTWDLIGGGLISDLIKHDRLDSAQDLVDRLQSALRRFKTELADIQISADMQVSIDGFLRFADYFFDGLFADWTVLDRISRSRSHIQDTANQIDKVLSRLNTMLSETEAEFAEFRAKIDETVFYA